MELPKLPKVIAIVGTNASGKSSVGIELAKTFNGEIISADSRQIYRGFNLCCGKITPDEAKIVPHHMLDIKDIGEPFSAAAYQSAVYKLIPQIIERSRTPFIVGGTGLYVESVIQGYEFENEFENNHTDSDSTDSEFSEFRKKLDGMAIDDLWAMLSADSVNHLSKNPSDSKNKRRIIRFIEKERYGISFEPRKTPKFNGLQIGITWPKEKLHERIDERLSLRIKDGMIDEVKNYLENNGQAEYLENLGLEYKYILWYLQGKYRSPDEFKLEMGRAIKRFAKSQMTWFRRDKSIHWIDMTADYLKQAQSLISDFLEFS
jgi:tRNA dimethylallyltransferase